MIRNYAIISCLILLSHLSLAQGNPRPVQFKNGKLQLDKNMLSKKISLNRLRDLNYRGKFYTILQFDGIPGPEEKSRLKAQGIRLFDYLPRNAYLAELNDSSVLLRMRHQHIAGMYAIPAALKLSSSLSLVNEQESISVAVSFYGSISRQQVISELEAAGALLIPTKIQPAKSVFVSANAGTIRKIASLPFVSFVSAHVLTDVPLNNNNRAIHGIDALGAPGGRNLQGKNISLGIGDNADPSTHIDFAGRLMQRNATAVNAHGTHTTGTLAGGGILNPRYKGMAPKATIISQYFSDIVASAPVYIHDNNMVITSNSYYNGADLCPGDGEYDVLSNFLDDQMNAYPSLLHVYAAGNDGALTCSPFPQSYGTIKSGFQCSKNVLSVGNMDNMTYKIYSGSSKGPANDGRLKPEIVAGGQNITSTLPFNTYGSISGTSMSCPTVAGSMGLLYERYRQLHAGANPDAAFIKAIACNGADDLGNPGPDFVYGFGMLNARNAVEMMEKNQYFTDSLNQGGSGDHSFNLPAGVYQLKVMLYWQDAAASPSPLSSLVNDLDLTVTGTDAVVHHPLILDPSPGGLTSNATEGVDSINNIEQVVINNPPAGNISIHVNGRSIPSGPQHYVVVYEVIYPSVTVEYPFGDETLVPGETEYIRWSAYGGDPNTFSVDYSADNGTSWNTLNSNVASTARLLAWTVPATATHNALIRVTRNSAGFVDLSDRPFTILGQPLITVGKPCRGYAQLIWNTIPSATGYDIMMLKGDSMQTVISTTDTSYVLPALNPDSTYWLSVRSTQSGFAGRRSVAASIVPDSGPCTLAAFNNDLSPDSLIAPLTGRIFTSTQLGSLSPTIEIRNLGTLATSQPLTISYQVNNGTVYSESYPGTIGAGSAFNFSFSNANSFDFSATGTYTIRCWISYPGDPQPLNDTLVATIKQLKNDPLVLSPAFTEDFESSTIQSHVYRTIGLDGLDRFDFNNTDPNGRVRTFINTGFARSGSRSAILDQVRKSGSTSSDSLIGTFNLSSYTPPDQIWLDFYYRNQGIDFQAPGNTIWIRGNDLAQWIAVDTLSTDPNLFGIYRLSKSIDVKGVLANAVPPQTVSSSFQVRFGEQGFTSSNSVVPDGDLDDGYSFDDITLTKSSNDASIVALLSPNFKNICGLSNAETISVQVKNYSTVALTNVPVTYAFNGDTVTETIPSINPLQTINYTFSQKADLSAYHQYRLGVWVSYPPDNYQRNDSITNIVFQTSPLVSSYPYLEGFENNNGYWFSQGVNNDWQWGAPQKTIINKAANGSNAWVTRLTGNYSDNQTSYLYSPCFDLTGLSHPVLSFSHIFQTEDNCDCDYHWIEYSTNDSSWTKLGTAGAGTNWYDNATKNAWQLSSKKWRVSSIDIPVIVPKIRFRFVMYSDPATDFEGVAIDDVHIFEKAPVYDSTTAVVVAKAVSGTDWVDFDLNGKRIASLNPNGQDLGNTSVTVYLHKGPVRDTTSQYYLDRNIVVQPSQGATAPVSVRFYFTDSEANRLINAVGCSSCTGIPDAYTAGVTQYSSQKKSEEDSTLANNIVGTYQFLKPRQDVHSIPYDNGYYAEYTVGNFSEFWINGGGPNFSYPIAGILLSFTATRENTKGELDWTYLAEKNIKFFVVQKSSDSLQYLDLATIPANGIPDSVAHSGYEDPLLWNGNNYYRLKLEYADGHVTYSPVQLITFDPNASVISVFPNPSKDIVFINTSMNCRQIAVFDVAGRLVFNNTVSGHLNKLTVAGLASGVYFVKIKMDQGDKVVKIVVQ